MSEKKVKWIKCSERKKMNLEQYVAMVFGESYNIDQKKERFHILRFFLNFKQLSKAEVLEELECFKSRVVKFLDGEINYIRNEEFNE